MIRIGREAPQGAPLPSTSSCVSEIRSHTPTRGVALHPTPGRGVGFRYKKKFDLDGIDTRSKRNLNETAMGLHGAS